MGKEIVYCELCGTRILAEEFDKGKAITLLNKNYCAKCKDKAIQNLEPGEFEQVLPQDESEEQTSDLSLQPLPEAKAKRQKAHSKSTGQFKTKDIHRGYSGARSFHRPIQSKKDKNTIIIIVAVVIFIIILIIVLSQK